VELKGAFSKNIEFVGYHDLGKKPGFQMAMQKVNGRYYIYTASFRHLGWNIVDVTDPANPKTVKWLPGPSASPSQGCPKIQIADGIMVTALGGLISFLHGTDDRDNEKAVAGIIVWDVKDPENPKQLSLFKVQGFGVHRFFYNGGRYVYISGTEKGFNGFILRIIDIQDPKNPVEVGRWWNSAQYLGDKKQGNIVSYDDEESLNLPFVHAMTVKDDFVYVANGAGGVVILNTADKTAPQLIGKLSLSPPLGGGGGGAHTHTVLPLGDRPYLVVTNEGERAPYWPGSADPKYGRYVKLETQPICLMGIVEITDIANPNLISVFPYPEVPAGYPHGNNFNVVDGIRIPFGPHNLFDVYGPDVYQKQDNKVYCAHFNAGLRIYDVSDPFIPKETAYFIPPDPKEPLFNNPEGTLFPGPLVGVAEDVLVDDRGYIYFDTFHDGLYIVREK
jgi:hypothetical protein